MTSKLKPCPFCGVEMRIETEIEGYNGDSWEVRFFEHPENDCILDGYDFDGEHFLYWNTRVNTSIDDKDPDVNEDVDGELARLEREIAEQSLYDLFGSTETWYTISELDSDWSISQYGIQRGLLERHPTDPNLVRLKAEKNDE